jgi:putative ABC transport system substrate-binding protein
VRRPGDLPPALERLSMRADAIFGIEDRTVFIPQTAKALLLFSFRNRIPLIGTSSAWTKAGALYALEPDYNDLGRRCGQAVARLLGQAKTGVTAAPRLLLSLNLRTARHMNVHWGSDIIQLASTVYE